MSPAGPRLTVYAARRPPGCPRPLSSAGSTLTPGKASSVQPPGGKPMKRLHVLAAAGLVALAACADQLTTPEARIEPRSPNFAIATSPFTTADDLAQTLGGPGVTIQNTTYSGSTAA